MNTDYSIAIIGGGPAGLTAAIYSQRAGKKVIVFERDLVGGMINDSAKVENIPGFIEISGNDFATQLADQAEACGATIAYEEATNVTYLEPINSYIIQTTDDKYQVNAVIIATGTKHNVLGLPDEEDLIGNGIHFCALCDGAFYKGKDVVVVGGGNSALTEALYLANICKTVTILQNLPKLTGDQILIEQINKTDNIRVITDCNIVSYCILNDTLSGVDYKLEADGETIRAWCDGVFLCIGLHPVSIESDVIPTNHKGYIISEHCPQGMFVAGDCSNDTEVKQVATACASGAVAATRACNYLRTL